MMPSINSFKRLDVRPLLARGEEPLSAVRQRIEALEAGQGLIVVAPFLPSPLIEFLESKGYQSRVERGTGTDWIVYFWLEAA